MLFSKERAGRAIDLSGYLWYILIEGFGYMSVKRIANNKGFTLIEVTVITIIATIIFVTVAGVFYQFSKGVFLTKARTLANNLAQEKIEVLKNISYYRLLVTRQSDLVESGGPEYDTRDYAPYAPESLLVGDIRFTRQVVIYKTRELSGGTLEVERYPDTIPDTGLKKIVVTIKWFENGVEKNMSMTNLRDNPDRVKEEGRIFGYVVSTGSAWGMAGSPPADRARLGSARIIVRENPAWEAYAGTNGYYEIKLATGTWSLWISKQGYWDQYTGGLNVTASPYEKNIELSQKLTGKVTGYVIMNEHLLISQVVTATQAPSGAWQEYIELYNPTTYQIRLGNGGLPTTANSWNYALKYYHEPSASLYSIVLDNTSLGGAPVDIPSGGFCLLAGASPLYIAGLSITPDALFSSFVAGYPDPTWGFLQGREAGGISLWKWENTGGMGGGQYLIAVDSVGWSDSKGLGHAPASYAYETDYIRGLTDNFFPGYGFPILRKTVFNAYACNDANPDAVLNAYMNDPQYGHAHDSNNNRRDFTNWSMGPGNSEAISPPKPRNTTSTPRLPRGGTPANGAIITCNDGLSSAVYSSFPGPYHDAAYFEITAATGTWKLSITYGNYFMEINNVKVEANQTITVPNSITNPCFPYNMFLQYYPMVNLSSSTTKGFIVGRVRCKWSPLNNIKVMAGLESAYTDSNGIFSITVDPQDLATVMANPFPDTSNNSSYSTEVATCSVRVGEISLVNFSLLECGRMYGWISMNTVDELPGVPVIARKGTIVKNSVSEEDGHFWFTGITTGTWYVKPQLEAEETPVPPYKNVDIGIGSSVFIESFTVSGAWGKISGVVKENSKLISTGVLIIATTDTLTLSNPENIDQSFRSGIKLYYGTVSKSDGTYELSVRGGRAYNVYAWYTKVQRNSVECLTDSDATPVITQNGEEQINFDW